VKKGCLQHIHTEYGHIKTGRRGRHLKKMRKKEKMNGSSISVISVLTALCRSVANIQ